MKMKKLRTRRWFRAASFVLALAVVLSAAMAAGSMVVNASTLTGPHLNYYGGKVISNVNVVQVIYGQGTYLSQTTSTGSPSVSSFYRGVTNSRYFDWLSEYNTTFSGGTNQTIGRGSFGGMFTIAPSDGNNGETVEDWQIQAELSAQLQAHHLPSPLNDVTGTPNTLYAIFLRHGQQVCQASGVCGPAGFCAYHSAIANVPGFGEIYYSVQLDLTNSVTCGPGTDFQNTTAVASQELIQSVTDPEAALATGLAAPLAWHDPTNGEIGDICQGQYGEILGGDSVRYRVQKEFSNQANKCVATRPPAKAFSMLALPPSVSIQTGGSGQTTLRTTLVSGAPDAVSLSVTRLPPGVTASLHPSSVIEGGSSTLTLTASILTPPGRYTLTVAGTNGASTHRVNVTVSVTRPPR